jgi:hypothetical protein
MLNDTLPSFRLPCSVASMSALSCVAVLLVCASPLAGPSISHLSSHGGISTVHQAPLAGVSRLRLVSPYAPGSAAVAISAPPASSVLAVPLAMMPFSFARKSARRSYILRVGICNHVLDYSGSSADQLSSFTVSFRVPSWWRSPLHTAGHTWGFGWER